MRELGDQIRDYIEGVAAPIGIDEVDALPGIDAALGHPARRRRATSAALAVAACLALLAGFVVLRDGPASDELLVGEPGPAPASWDWLDSFGTEAPSPSVPEGWKVMDFADFRFAVPPDWVVPISGSCRREAPGIVLVSSGEEAGATCTPPEAPPSSVLTIEPSPTPDVDGTAVTVGTLPAVRVDAACGACPPTYRFESGYQITVTGPDADGLLATFTDAGSLRVLQAGAQLGMEGWRTVEYEGISFRVPGDSPVVDLPATYYEEVRPDGGRSFGGRLNPGQCGGALFTEGDVLPVFLGTSPILPRCRIQTEMDLAPADGVWVRSIAEGEFAALGEHVATGDVGGLDVTVVRVDRVPTRTVSAVLDLVVRTPQGSVWMTIGVGTDSSMARTIMRSLAAI